MNVYEEAHALARAIKESEEYKQFKASKDKVDANPEISKMLTDFESKQMEQQNKMMMGENITEDVQNQIQELYQIIMKDPMAAEYLQTSMRFSVMMSDVYKILGDAMGIVSDK